MGFSNGNLTSNDVKVQRGERGERGVGFHLTADHHYHIRNKLLTDVAAPVDDQDVSTKKFVTDLFKNKLRRLMSKMNSRKKQTRVN